jgi:LysR family transcriptional activator of nhaA
MPGGSIESIQGVVFIESVYDIPMSWLNHIHLRCFWATVREGGVTAASRALHVSQPTVSAHLRTLETVIGERLLERSSKGVSLTAVGRTTYRYADEIFRLSAELEGTLRGDGVATELSVRLGVADVVPKFVAHHIVAPALRGSQPARLECFEGKPVDLVTRLARGELDAVLADTPVDPQYHVNAFNHLLGESGLTVFASAADAPRYRAGYPGSLDGAPFLLPTRSSVMRREMDRWFSAQRIYPDVRAEFEDMALLREFAADGLGLFVLPTVVEGDVRRHCRAHVVSRIEDVRERFYVITLQRRVRHAAVTAIVQGAREELFA